MLLDSNIVIYGIRPDRRELRVWINGLRSVSISSLTRVEVLGYHKLTE